MYLLTNSDQKIRFGSTAKGDNTDVITICVVLDHQVFVAVNDTWDNHVSAIGDNDSR